MGANAEICLREVNITFGAAAAATATAATALPSASSARTVREKKSRSHERKRRRRERLWTVTRRRGTSTFRFCVSGSETCGRRRWTKRGYAGVCMIARTERKISNIVK